MLFEPWNFGWMNNICNSFQLNLLFHFLFRDMRLSDRTTQHGRKKHIYFLIILFACLTQWLNQKGGLGAEPLKKTCLSCWHFIKKGIWFSRENTSQSRIRVKFGKSGAHNRYGLLGKSKSGASIRKYVIILVIHIQKRGSSKLYYYRYVQILFQHAPLTYFPVILY